MPLYEYQCDSCGHRFEAIQKFSDQPLEKCPKCGAAVRKLQAAPAFQFKGSGWYITDYAKKDSASGGKSGESQPTGADSKKESGSDAKGTSPSSTPSTTAGESSTKSTGTKGST